MDQLKLTMLRDTEDNGTDNRWTLQTVCLWLGLTSRIALFFIGLVLGAPGGLLFGGVALMLVQSLEHQVDNKLIMALAENYTMHNNRHSKYIDMLNIEISVFVVVVGTLISILSLAAGIGVGSWAYSLEIKRKGEEEKEKALTVAGTVCLTAVTLTGYIVGWTFEMILTFVPFGAMVLLLIALVIVCLLQIKSFVMGLHDCAFLSVILCISCALTVRFDYLSASLLFRTRLVLISFLLPVTLAVNLRDRHTMGPINLNTGTMRLILIISDVYSIAGQRIVALPSPTFTTLSNAVAEDIFVGVLASLLWMAAVGTSLFVYWQKGGAGKICAAAAASGTAFITAIKVVLPALGPVANIGGLMGVAGAVGVSLAAAGAFTDQYGLRFVGRLGVTVGAALGAFVMSCAHSGLSRMFMALCAATIAPAAFIIEFLSSVSWRCTVHFYVHVIPATLIFISYWILPSITPANRDFFMWSLFYLYETVLFLWHDFSHTSLFFGRRTHSTTSGPTVASTFTTNKHSQI